MAFFHTSKLPKRQLYGQNLSLGNKPPSPISMMRANDGLLTGPIRPQPQLRSPQSPPPSPSWMNKRQEMSSHCGYESDEDFVRHINQIIERKNFRMIDRQNEMQTNSNQVQIKIDCVGFLPNELQVRYTGSNRLEVQGEHLEFYSQRLAVKKQLHRCYPLPQDVDVQSIHCKFTKNGTLKIRVNRDPLLLETKLASQERAALVLPKQDKQREAEAEEGEEEDCLHRDHDDNLGSPFSRSTIKDVNQLKEKGEIKSMQMRSKGTLMKLKMGLNRDADDAKRGLM